MRHWKLRLVTVRWGSQFIEDQYWRSMPIPPLNPSFESLPSGLVLWSRNPQRITTPSKLSKVVTDMFLNSLPQTELKLQPLQLSTLAWIPTAWPKTRIRRSLTPSMMCLSTNRESRHCDRPLVCQVVVEVTLAPQPTLICRSRVCQFTNRRCPPVFLTAS